MNHLQKKTRFVDGSKYIVHAYILSEKEQTQKNWENQFPFFWSMFQCFLCLTSLPTPHSNQRTTPQSIKQFG